MYMYNHNFLANVTHSLFRSRRVVHFFLSLQLWLTLEHDIIAKLW